MNYISINEAVLNIKQLIEEAIQAGGTQAKNNLIRSQMPICILHDAVKAEFIKYGVNPDNIHPSYGTHSDELKLAGFFKFKDQDICLNPNDLNKNPEILQFEGILKGKNDPYGKIFTERILSVNVRSQLSSTSKNFDTLYERTFAEALNLHLRCPNMVLGEFYMIPVFEYDDTLAKRKIVAFKRRNRNIQKHIEKYIYSFSAINNRSLTSQEYYKYERVCLLIVDFNREIPKIYNTNQELISDGLLSPTSSASIDHINFPTFANSLLDIYSSRFGEGKFI